MQIGAPEADLARSMLTRVEIRRFRSCQDVVLDGLSSLTALVGRNGAGKTNVLKAIKWAAASAVRDEVQRPETRERDSSVVRLDFRVSDRIYTFEAEVARAARAPKVQRSDRLSVETPQGRHSVLERRQGTVAITDGTSFRLGLNAPVLTTVETRLPGDHPDLQSIHEARVFLDSLQYTTLAEPDDPPPSEYALVPSDEDDLPDALGQPVGALLRLRRNDGDRYAEVTSILGPQGLDLAEVAFRELSPQTPREPIYISSFRPGGQDQTFRFDQLSYGTRRLVRFFTALFARDYSVLLLEHLEEGLHPGLLRKVIDVLKSYSDRGQLILTTHSPTVLNLLEPSQLRFVTMRAGETLVRALSAQELEAARRYIEYDGSLAEFAETLDD